MWQTWELSPRIALWIYTAIIRPMLTNGAVVWGPKAKQTTVIRKLKQIQRIACLYTTEVMKKEVDAGETRRRLWREALNSLQILQANTDSIAPRFVFHRPYKICISNITEEPTMADTIRIYTDGFKTEHSSGCGIYSKSLKLKIKWAMSRYVRHHHA